MPQQYVNVTQEELEQTLAPQGFKKLVLPNTVELVYGKRVQHASKQLTLRVYTGIMPSGISRDVGKDAMRVVLFMRDDKGRIFKLGGSKRVHRVLGWRKNIQKRIDSWLEYLPTDECPNCKMPLLPKEGHNGKFLGCAGYPDCNFTRNLNK